MKKVMKALALALALCMVISVSAFAEVGKTDDGTPADTTARTIDFTVTGLQANEQVALLVLKDGVTGGVSAATESDILYIDQKAVASDADSVAFTATIAAGEGNDVVDVYVGSQTINSEKSGAWLAYENIAVAETSSITLSTTAATILNVGQTVGDGESAVEITRPGAAIGVNVKKKALDKMIWVLKDSNAATNPYRFSKAVDIDVAESLDGEVWFTGVFSSANLNGFNIDTVAAIFLDADGSTEYYIGTEKEDVEDYKKK